MNTGQKYSGYDACSCCGRRGVLHGTYGTTYVFHPVTFAEPRSQPHDDKAHYRALARDQHKRRGKR